MAASFKEDADGRQNLGPSGIIAVVDMTFAAADYATGGYAVTPAALGGLSRIRGIQAIRFLGTTAIGYNWNYNGTTGKIMALGGAASAGTAFQEAAASTDFSDSTVRLLVYGF